MTTHDNDKAHEAAERGNDLAAQWERELIAEMTARRNKARHAADACKEGGWYRGQIEMQVARYDDILDALAALATVSDASPSPSVQPSDERINGLPIFAYDVTTKSGNSQMAYAAWFHKYGNPFKETSKYEPLVRLGDVRALLAQPASVQGVSEQARASLAAAPQQEPVGEVVLFGGECKEVAWSKGKMPPPGTKLYAAHPQAAQPKGWQKDLIQLLISIRPKFGAIGSRDVDVRKQQEQIDAAIAILNRPDVAQPQEAGQSKLRATLYAIAHTLDDHELRQAAKEAYEASGDVQEVGQARELPPPNSLPTWSECNLIIENHEFRRRAAEGSEGSVLDTPPTTPEPTALHRFIYEYDDGNRYRSAWFMHRLELVLKEAAQVAPAVPEGYAIVPKEPTEEMHVAAVQTITRCTGNDDFPPRVWRAMIATAPSAPSVSDAIAARLQKIASLAQQGMCHGLLADDYCSQIAAIAAQSKEGGAA
jgi:hypothetical protein